MCIRQPGFVPTAQAMALLGVLHPTVGADRQRRRWPRVCKLTRRFTGVSGSACERRVPLQDFGTTAGRLANRPLGGRAVSAAVTGAWDCLGLG